MARFAGIPISLQFPFTDNLTKRATSDRDNITSAFQESLTRSGELRAMGEAVKQRRSDLRLQILDLLAEWRLPDSDLGGSAREVPLLRDRQEIADVTQLHRHLQKQSSEPPTYIG
jgi:hypothetical protein